ncbi:MAG: hypothetical protein ACK5MK_06895 [Dysgonomonas sp.]
MKKISNSVCSFINTYKLRFVMFLGLAAATGQEAKAQIFGNSGSDIVTELESYWVWVVLGVFIVVMAFNLGNFVGDNRDIKTGVKNVIIFVVAVGAITGAYQYLKSTAKL